MHKIKRAIILAGGRGKRLRPYTNATPKPLLQVGGKPIIEYSIELLLQKGIKDITIVTGYRSSQFKYLSIKYDVTLMRNKDFNHGSNLLSLRYAANKIDDCVILDGDMLLGQSAIRNEVCGSGYSYVKRSTASEWAIIFTNGNRIDSIVADSTEKRNFNALYSISYWVGDTAKKYRHAIMKAKDDVRYVDDIAITMPNLYGFKVASKDLIEIDTVEDYEKCLKNYGRN